MEPNLVAVSDEYSFYADYPLEKYKVVNKKTGETFTDEQFFLDKLLEENLTWTDTPIQEWIREEKRMIDEYNSLKNRK